MAAIARAAAKEGIKAAKAEQDAKLRAEGKDPDDIDGGPSELEIAQTEFDGMRVTRDDYRYFACLAPCLAWYRNLTLDVAIFLTRPEWEYFILGTIILAGALVGVQTFDGMEEDPIVQYLDIVILVIFSIEIFLKMFAEGFKPFRFFYNKDWAWNWFDLIVVMLCMPIPGNPATGYAAILRLARLARLMKLINKVPELKMIVGGMIGGLRAIFYICLLLFMVFYIYGIAGIVLFRDNDPWHFDNFAESFTTLYRMATMEDWTDVMYINMYGCDQYHHGIYHNATDPAIAAIKGYCMSDTKGDVSCGTQYTKNVNDCIQSFDFDACTTTVAACDQLQDVHLAGCKALCTDYTDNNDAQCKWAAGRDMETSHCNNPVAQPFYAVVYSISFSVISGLVMLSMFVGAVSLSMTSSIDEIADQQASERKRRLKMLNSQLLDELNDPESAAEHPIEEYERLARVERELQQVWDGRETSLSTHLKNKFTLDPSLKKLSPLSQTYMVTVAIPVRRITRSAAFNNIILVAIIVACLLVGIETDPQVKDNPKIKDPVIILNSITAGAFAVECVMKIVAEGITPWRYFLQGENVMDFVIVVGSFVGGRLVMLLRMVRLFRVLKLVKSVPELRMHVTALIKGVQSIGYIGTIMFMFFYMFGIIGWILFKDNDPWHFKHIGYSMLTLLRCATFEDWTDVMYINKYGCDRFGYLDYPEDCVAPSAFGGWAVIFFMVFETMGSLVLLNLFIGVITASMEESADDLKEEKKMEEKIKRIAQEYKLSRQRLKNWREVFDLIDVAGAGEIDRAEFHAAFEKVGHMKIGSEEIDLLYNEVSEGYDDSVADADVIDEAAFIKFMAKGYDIKGGFSEDHKKMRASMPSPNSDLAGSGTGRKKEKGTDLVGSSGRKKEKGTKYVL